MTPAQPQRKLTIVPLRFSGPITFRPFYESQLLKGELYLNHGPHTRSLSTGLPMVLRIELVDGPVLDLPGTVTAEHGGSGGGYSVQLMPIEAGYRREAEAWMAGRWTPDEDDDWDDEVSTLSGGGDGVERKRSGVYKVRSGVMDQIKTPSSKPAAPEAPPRSQRLSVAAELHRLVAHRHGRPKPSSRPQTKPPIPEKKAKPAPTPPPAQVDSPDLSPAEPETPPPTTASGAPIDPTPTPEPRSLAARAALKAAAAVNSASRDNRPKATGAQTGGDQRLGKTELLAEARRILERTHLQDPFGVLGLQPGADRQQIQLAFAQLIKRFHTDRYTADVLDDDLRRQLNRVTEKITSARKLALKKLG